VNLGDSVRLAIALTPKARGAFSEQARDVFGQMREALVRHPLPLEVITLTVFLEKAADIPECRRLVGSFFGTKPPVTNYVLQAPCTGAVLAIEAWAVGGEGVRVERFGEHALAVTYDSVRWVYCAGITPPPNAGGVYEQTRSGFEMMRGALVQAGSGFEHVVRTWLYLSNITAPEDADHQRYKELNRGRTDFYHGIRFYCSLLDPNAPRGVYPASTGIGMAGGGIVMSCVALETRRDDVFLLPLENPQQTPAYAYHPRYSPQSPKFSRAVALALGDSVTTWISGTASIVNSESLHPGNLEKQTEQTIDNIERLIAPENLALHGVRGAGSRLSDLAKIRVYLKRAQDYAKCKAICDRRFGPVPASYAVADVCRPELLVEIEGVAFAKYAPPRTLG
jgi:enamine deaminase RidA (YjgF/YER057c/UK114 family)